MCNGAMLAGASSQLAALNKVKVLLGSIAFCCDGYTTLPLLSDISYRALKKTLFMRIDWKAYLVGNHNRSMASTEDHTGEQALLARSCRVAQ